MGAGGRVLRDLSPKGAPEVSEPITVIIPTIGRYALHDALASIAPQLNAEDHVLVACDGVKQWPWVKETVSDFADDFPHAEWTCFYEKERQGYWGHAIANQSLSLYVTEGSWVWRMDDDDVATPHALESLRDAQKHPWAVFRMTFGPGHYAEGMTIWREPRLRHGDVGTPMFFAPLCNARFGLEYAGDWVYAEALQAELGPPVFREEVVCVVRPEAQEEEAA